MKILIVYASAGVGHKKAAEAAYEAFSKDKAGCEVKLADILDYTNSVVKRAYPALYLFTIKYIPSVWGLIFKITNNRKFYKIIIPLKLLLERLNSPRFQEYLKKEKFDVIISTHFYSSAIAGILKRVKAINSKLITVVTDYLVHSFWLTAENDYFVVASSKAREELLRDGIADEKIKVLGIPVGGKFLLKKDSARIKDKLNLRPKKITMLIMGGGFGVGPYEYLLKELSPFSEKVELIFVCGYNEGLYKKLKLLSAALKTDAKIFKYVDNIDELMEASDILVSKAGGITVSEALVKGVPILAIRPIPGQEESNARLMQELKVLKNTSNKEEALSFLKNVIEEPDILEKMKENAGRAARPKAAEELVNLAGRIERDYK
ncbi:MAG: glycosyltransferase [Candidatus Omnitrophica bacterium]|nr:glycosyltransferase [Candidatus Omnitrophota bacterium]